MATPPARDVAEGPAPEKTFFGQPRPLVNIFSVELWERFSFYGMQGILLIYLYYSVAEGGLAVPQGTAESIVGAYGGMVYLSAILGAWAADRLMGSERVLFYSAIVIMIGHVALSLLPGLLGVAVGLILIAVGSGGLKANTTSVVGTLYAPGDNRRDAGFSIFYLGINLGAFLGPILTGLVQSTWGFQWGFALASFGMAIGLVQYSFARRRLPATAKVAPNPLPSSRRVIVVVLAAAGAALLAAAILTGLVTADNLALIVVGATAIAAIAYFAVILRSRRITRIERHRVWAFLPLFIASTAFWSLYQQQFTVLTVYSDKRLDRDLFGWEFPVSWVQAINPVFIILLSGVFAALWTRMGSRQPSTVVKFSLGTIVMGLAFLLFLVYANGGANATPVLGLTGILFVFTIAELLLSPVGLSASTKLAPAIFRTQMVALFYLSVGLGTALAGVLAAYYDPSNEVPYFGLSGLVAIVLGLLLWAVAKPVLRLMEGVR